MLVARRTKPPFQWSFPGGRLDPRESAEEAAIREVREEVGLEIEVIAQSGVREVSAGDQRFLITVFAARLVSGEAQTGPEASEVRWVEVDEIDGLDASTDLAAFAADARRYFLAAKP